ncbi:hypothetical protein [Mycobacteroides abscessus]|uniref:hypothetical protein n=1 Tax=Mycobacteroides abscessus TaxID=36809 RepID=UPI0009A78841|nr:hypothetical protein [Mycobacteroides abscessus]SKO14914.1 Uncharacterised protein [Mycobacteroides abscessus subsp. bolletii]SKX37551.1 Uncharacterised protein [Mycobacteroides abscessus subsp. bolletii]
MTTANADSSGDIVAEAISRRRTVQVGVNADGYVAYVQFGRDVKDWGARRIGEAIVKVAAVAHDRYVVFTDESGTSALTADQVAEAELQLDF